MWKLTQKDFRKFHITYGYSVLVIFFFPLFMALFIYKPSYVLGYGGGYSLVYIILGYPILLVIYFILHAYVNLLKSKFRYSFVILFYILTVFGMLYLYLKWFYNFSIDGKEIANTTVWCSIILFIGYLNLDDQAVTSNSKI